MKKALLVIDMQNDYLWEKRHKRFSYDTEALCASVNKLIHEFDDNKDDVIYIRHIIQNLPTNRALFGYSLYGTKGAEIYPGVDIVSKYCFDKYVGDALSNKELRKLIKKNKYDKLYLCGLDKYGCLTATSLGAKKRGIEAVIINSGTATVFPEKKAAKAQKKLDAAKIEII